MKIQEIFSLGITQTPSEWVKLQLQKYCDNAEIVEIGKFNEVSLVEICKWKIKKDHYLLYIESNTIKL